jgi:hypothetical protein
VLFRKPDQVLEPLYAIVPVQNQWRWRSRWKHTERAIKHFIDSGAVVVLVEAAFGRRQLAFENSGLHGLKAECTVLGTKHNYRHMYIGLRTRDELWLKENLINVAVGRLPQDWEQVCWLDSDVHFLRPNWVGECIHKLQHYAFLQMFSHARDLGPDYEMLPEDYPHANGAGFIRAWRDGVFDIPIPVIQEDVKKLQADLAKLNVDLATYGYPPRVWPGLAWAATRKAWDDVGGLMDFAVWGGGDFHTAHALIENRKGMMRNDLHRNYKKMVDQWYYRCHTHVRRNVGVMDGSILHHWHGRKTERGYNAKHKLLSELGFDPLRHLKRDSQGLYQLHDDRSTAFVSLRDMMRKIARERNEDSIDVVLPVRGQGH